VVLLTKKSPYYRLQDTCNQLTAAFGKLQILVIDYKGM